ncbi:MAG: hypothetical protein V5A38_10230 [Halolamina sp.]
MERIGFGMAVTAASGASNELPHPLDWGGVSRMACPVVVDAANLDG